MAAELLPGHGGPPETVSPKKTLPGRLGLLAEFLKVRIAFLTGLSTLTGFILATGQISSAVVLPAMGLFLLAAGAGALNNLQDRRIDALMERTRGRALPSGALGPGGAACIAGVFLVTGSALLALGGPKLIALGIAPILVYNGAYTYLKRIVWWAFLPGVLAGIAGPAVGWSAGGGGLTDPRFVPLAIFFSLWQVPHFWMLTLRYGNQCAGAGLPSARERLDTDQIRRITAVWSWALAAVVLLFPLFGTVERGFAPLLLLPAAVLAYSASRSTPRDGRAAQRLSGLPMGTPAYLLVTMAALCAVKLL